MWFLDERKGWTGHPGYVHRTVDGGSTWQTFAAPVRGVRCIAFATAANGWIGSVVDSIALWSTTGGGATWSSVDLPAPKPRGLCGLSVVGTSVVYGCGAWYGTPTVVKSLDGGSTWKSIDLSNVATGLVDCHFFSPDSGFVAGRVGTALTERREVILFTADGGETWETRYTGTHLESWCWKISFPSRQVGYVSVESHKFPQTPTHCLKTDDGGRTWREVRLSETALFVMQGIGFVTEQQGWAGGPGGRGSLLWTSDGGLTWEGASWGTNINRICFLGPKIGYARTFDNKCATCIWGCRIAVELIIDQWNPGQKRYREETFCYGPLSCHLYKAGSTLKVPGRKGMSWEEEDWVDEETVRHRGPDD